MKAELTPQIAAMYVGQNAETPHRHYPGNKGKSVRKVGKIMDVDLVINMAGIWFPTERKEDLENFYIADLKLVLRKLESMTEEEAREVSKLWNVSEDAQNIKHLRKRLAEYSCSLGHWMKIQPYLLSKGFDLFGLLEAKLAVELDKPVTQ